MSPAPLRLALVLALALALALAPLAAAARPRPRTVRTTLASRLRSSRIPVEVFESEMNDSDSKFIRRSVSIRRRSSPTPEFNFRHVRHRDTRPG